MACVLALPNREQKGILSVTTAELNQITENGRLTDETLELKKRYFLGLHYNWHPVNFDLSSDFDFHFLESKDAIFLNGNENLLEMDACNFTPRCFSKRRNSPTWDVLIVGRSANFKRPFKTLETVRELFDRGHLLNVLWICPMELENGDERAIVKAYEQLFSPAEKELFTLLNPQSNYPFTFSREELSLFYLSSRLYVHFADVETRCRSAAYAFCAGTPVIGNSKIANILPKELAIEPTFFVVQNDDYVSSILRANDKSIQINQNECINTLSEISSIDRLVANLNRCLNPYKKFVVSQLFARNLDIRLGVSHTGNTSSNSYGVGLVEFMQQLGDMDVTNFPEGIDMNSSDPENLIMTQMKAEILINQNLQIFSISKNRLAEINLTRRGTYRFLIYRVIKVASNIPIIGSRLRKLYVFLKLR